MKRKKRVSLIKSPDGTNYLIPFILVTSLFLLWGFAHGLLDVLNKHFQNILHVSKAQSGFVQFSLYINMDELPSDTPKKLIPLLREYPGTNLVKLYITKGDLEIHSEGHG